MPAYKTCQDCLVHVPAWRFLLLSTASASNLSLPLVLLVQPCVPTSHPQTEEGGHNSGKNTVMLAQTPGAVCILLSLPPPSCPPPFRFLGFLFSCSSGGIRSRRSSLASLSFDCWSPFLRTVHRVGQLHRRCRAGRNEATKVTAILLLHSQRRLSKTLLCQRSAGNNAQTRKLRMACVYYL